MSHRKIVFLPKNFTATNVVEFINDCEPIFALKRKEAVGFTFDLSKVKQCSMLGSLIFYKIIEFSTIHKCFLAPTIEYDENSAAIEAFQKYGFWELINNYIQNKSTTQKIYKRLKIKVEDNFIVAPQALLRQTNFSDENLRTIILPRIEDYYSFNTKAVAMIFLCLSEVLLNFWEHAVDDTQSIIVANGNKQNIEIACADTGEGIVTSLQKTGKYKKEDNRRILEYSVKKGVTSKEKTNHMGYGLWILDQIVKLVKGRLHLYSQGAYYFNDYGKITSGKCGIWEGTVIYLSLPLREPKTLIDVSGVDEKKGLEDLKINWL